MSRIVDVRDHTEIQQLLAYYVVRQTVTSLSLLGIPILCRRINLRPNHYRVLIQREQRSTQSEDVDEGVRSVGARRTTTICDITPGRKEICEPLAWFGGFSYTALREPPSRSCSYFLPNMLLALLLTLRITHVSYLIWSILMRLIVPHEFPETSGFIQLHALPASSCKMSNHLRRSLISLTKAMNRNHISHPRA